MLSGFRSLPPLQPNPNFISLLKILALPLNGNRVPSDSVEAVVVHGTVEDGEHIELMLVKIIIFSDTGYYLILSISLPLSLVAM